MPLQRVRFLLFPFEFVQRKSIGGCLRKQDKNGDKDLDKISVLFLMLHHEMTILHVDFEC